MLTFFKPGGSIFLTTFNKTMESWIGGIIFAENILRLVPENTHDWEKFIAPKDVQRILDECMLQHDLILVWRYD